MYGELRQTAPRPVALLVFLLSASLAAPAPLEAQASPHDRMPGQDEDFCGQLFLEIGGRVFGHEYTEFFHTPAVADEAPADPHAHLEGPVRADRIALWWALEPDSLGAWMVGEEETVWQLRLGPGRGSLEGTLRQAVPRGSPHEARAYVMRVPCRAHPLHGGGDPGHRRRR